MAGMGGSSIAGEICRELFLQESPVPIITTRDYSLPQAVRADWAVIVVSYSGNTEETITVFKEARKRGCHIFGVTTGGNLAILLKANELQLIPAGLQPRAALPLMFSVIYPLIGELVHPIEFDSAAVSKELKSLRTSWNNDPDQTPITIARQIHNRIPLFIGWRHLGAVAYRAKCQVNENAKSPAISVELPEMDHNEIEASGLYSQMSIQPIFLRSRYEDARATKRIEATKSVLEKNGEEIIEIKPKGTSRVTETLASILLLDEVSLRLALIRGVNPLQVTRIQDLKKIMSRE